MENSIIEEFTRGIISKQESLLKERLFEYIGYELDILEESKRRFPRLLRVSKYNGADFYWNDGSIDGIRIITFIQEPINFNDIENGKISVKAITGGKGESTMKGGMGNNGIYGNYSHETLGNNAGGLGDENGEETVEDWSCVDGCPIKIMDEQSGILKSGKMKQFIEGGKYNVYGKMYPRNVETIGDSGGASRFFYTAKASKSERNFGLGGFDNRQSVGGGGGIGNYLEDVNSASGKYGSEKAPSKNFHPTVKPVKLLQFELEEYEDYKKITENNEDDEDINGGTQTSLFD